jgi:hypothetical protein
MKGQVSTELLVVVALVLLIFIPLLVLVYSKANEANQEIAAYQAELSVSRIASLANSVGSLGTDTSVTTDVFIPPNTIELNASNTGAGSVIQHWLDTPQGPKDIPGIMKFPLKNSPVTLADSSNAGGWIRVNISSTYEGGQAVLEIKSN